MFTLKFHRISEDNRQEEFCISCKAFDTLEFDEGNGYEIIAYSSFFKGGEDGVSVRVVDKQNTPNEYSSCYVENDSGKTIGHYYIKR